MSPGELTLQSSQPAHAVAGALSPENHELLTKFRQQIHAVGAVWILAGALWLSLGVYVAFIKPTFMNIDTDVMIVGGLVWLALGTLTCLKNMPALTAALVLSYATLAFSLANGRSGGALLLLAIIQGHRVRGFARKLTAEGIALTAKP